MSRDSKAVKWPSPGKREDCRVTFRAPLADFQLIQEALVLFQDRSATGELPHVGYKSPDECHLRRHGWVSGSDVSIEVNMTSDVMSQPQGSRSGLMFRIDVL